MTLKNFTALVHGVNAACFDGTLVILKVETFEPGQGLWNDPTVEGYCVNEAAGATIAINALTLATATEEHLFVIACHELSHVGQPPSQRYHGQFWFNRFRRFSGRSWWHEQVVQAVQSDRAYALTLN